MVTKIAAFSCLHAPLTNKSYFEWLLRSLEEFKPDYVINLGDWYEGKAAKRWPVWSDEKWTLADEHAEVARQARSIKNVVPEAKLVWLWGNHDGNTFGDDPERLSDDLRSVAHYRWNRETWDALRGWNIVEKYGHRVKLRLGPITFQHGCATSINALKDSAYEHGTPYGLYVCGHTHRPQVVTRAEERQRYLPYWFANPGTGAEWDRMHYMDRLSISKWGRGLVLIETKGVDQRRTAYASKVWDAELKIHSMAADG